MGILNKIEKLTGKTIEPNCNGLLVDGNFIGKIKLKKVAKQLMANKHFKPQDNKPIETIDGETALYLFYKKRYALMITKDGGISFNLN